MKQRNILLALLVALSVITFLDRLCISVAGPRMQKELGISPEQWGWVLGAFVLAYGLFEIPTGAMGDSMGQRRVLTRIVLWWSVFTMLTGSVSSLVPLVIIRFLFGAGEAGAYPNIAGVISRWFPGDSRARAQGFIWGASRAGGALAPWIVVPLQLQFGWRAAFWAFGALGILWCAVWWFWYRDRAVDAAGSIGHGPAPWGTLFRSPQLWLIIAMYFSQAWGSWFYFNWLPTFLVKGRGFTEGEMGFFSAFPFLLASASNIAGGFLSDFAVRKLGPRRGRTIVGSLGLAASAVLLATTALSTGKTTTIVLLSLGFGVADLMLPSAWAICLDVGGPHAGSVTGAMNMAGQFGGFLCTVVFGHIVGRTGDYNLPLFIIAVMVGTGAILFSRIDATRPLAAGRQPAAAEGIR